MNAAAKSSDGSVFQGEGQPAYHPSSKTPNLNAFERVAEPSGTRPSAGGRGKGVIAAIHTLKSRLKLTDDDYRALLIQLTGKSSSKDCTLAQQLQLRDHLQRLTERMGIADPVRRAGFAERVKAASPRERKVWAIWLDLARRGLVNNKSGQALDAFVYRQTGVTALRWCTPAQLDSLIEALKLWQKRGMEVRP